MERHNSQKVVRKKKILPMQIIILDNFTQPYDDPALHKQKA